MNAIDTRLCSRGRQGRRRRKAVTISVHIRAKETRLVNVTIIRHGASHFVENCRFLEIFSARESRRLCASSIARDLRRARRARFRIAVRPFQLLHAGGRGTNSNEWMVGNFTQNITRIQKRRHSGLDKQVAAQFSLSELACASYIHVVYARICL